MPRASVTVTLTGDTVNLGEELSGILHVTSEREFDAEELRVEIYGLARSRDLGIDAGRRVKERLWWILWRVSGPLHLTRGYEQEFPFSVRIPTQPGMNIYGLDGLQAFEATLPMQYREFEEAVKDRWKTALLLVRMEWVEWEVKGILARKSRLDINSETIGFKVTLPSSPISLERPPPRVEDVQTIYCNQCGRPITPEMRLSGIKECPHCGTGGGMIFKLTSLMMRNWLERMRDVWISGKET